MSIDSLLTLWIVAGSLFVCFILLLVSLTIKTHRNRVQTGVSGLIGSTGTAETIISKSGKVFVSGELWNAYSDDKIVKGSKVEIVDVEGMTLKVKKH